MTMRITLAILLFGLICILAGIILWDDPIHKVSAGFAMRIGIWFIVLAGVHRWTFCKDCRRK